MFINLTNDVYISHEWVNFFLSFYRGRKEQVFSTQWQIERSHRLSRMSINWFPTRLLAWRTIVHPDTLDPDLSEQSIFYLNLLGIKPHTSRSDGQSPTCHPSTMPVHKELIMMLRSDQEPRDFFLSFERDVRLQYPHQQSFEFFLLIKNTVILIKHVEIIQQVYGMLVFCTQRDSLKRFNTKPLESNDKCKKKRFTSLSRMYVDGRK